MMEIEYEGIKAQIMAVAVVQLLIDKGVITAAEYQALVKQIGKNQGMNLEFKIEATDEHCPHPMNVHYHLEGCSVPGCACSAFPERP